MFKELLNLWKKQDLSKQLIQKSLETLRTDYKMFTIVCDNVMTLA